MSEQFGGSTPLAVGCIECYNSILHKIRQVQTSSAGASHQEVPFMRSQIAMYCFLVILRGFYFIYFYNRSCWPAFCISSENKMIEIFLDINK